MARSAERVYYALATYHFKIHCVYFLLSRLNMKKKQMSARSLQSFRLGCSRGTWWGKFSKVFIIQLSSWNLWNIRSHLASVKSGYGRGKLLELTVLVVVVVVAESVKKWREIPPYNKTKQNKAFKIHSFCTNQTIKSPTWAQTCKKWQMVQIPFAELFRMCRNLPT